MSKAYESMVRMLSMREHGAMELCDKLLRKGYAEEDIEAALTTCQELGLQSDKRFVESLFRTRIRQGYGPLRIGQDLSALKIDKELVQEQMALWQDEWESLAHEVRLKKYKEDAASYKEEQKQKQFLYYRGFPMDLIARVFSKR